MGFELLFVFSAGICVFAVLRNVMLFWFNDKVANKHGAVRNVLIKIVKTITYERANEHRFGRRLMLFLFRVIGLIAFQGRIHIACKEALFGFHSRQQTMIKNLGIVQQIFFGPKEEKNGTVM